MTILQFQFHLTNCQTRIATCILVFWVFIFGNSPEGLTGINIILMVKIYCSNLVRIPSCKPKEENTEESGEIGAHGFFCSLSPVGVYLSLFLFPATKIQVYEQCFCPGKFTQCPEFLLGIDHISNLCLASTQIPDFRRKADVQCKLSFFSSFFFLYKSLGTVYQSFQLENRDKHSFIDAQFSKISFPRRISKDSSLRGTVLSLFVYFL